MSRLRLGWLIGLAIALAFGCHKDRDESVIASASAAAPKGDTKGCAGVNLLGRHTLSYDYASVSQPGKVFTGSKSEWHLHTQKGCFFWGLGMWSKPKENKRGCVSWVLYLENNGAGPLVGMFKDLKGDRFLGYGRIDPRTGNGVVWDRFKDPKVEAVTMKRCKKNCGKLYKTCKAALAAP